MKKDYTRDELEANTMRKPVLIQIFEDLTRQGFEVEVCEKPKKSDLVQAILDSQLARTVAPFNAKPVVSEDKKPKRTREAKPRKFFQLRSQIIVTLKPHLRQLNFLAEGCLGAKKRGMKTQIEFVMDNDKILDQQGAQEVFDVVTWLGAKEQLNVWKWQKEKWFRVFVEVDIDQVSDSKHPQNGRATIENGDVTNGRLIIGGEVENEKAQEEVNTNGNLGTKSLRQQLAAQFGKQKELEELMAEDKAKSSKEYKETKLFGLLNHKDKRDQLLTESQQNIVNTLVLDFIVPVKNFPDSVSDCLQELQKLAEKHLGEFEWQLTIEITKEKLEAIRTIVQLHSPNRQKWEQMIEEKKVKFPNYYFALNPDSDSDVSRYTIVRQRCQS